MIMSFFFVFQFSNNLNTFTWFFSSFWTLDYLFDYTKLKQILKTLEMWRTSKKLGNVAEKMFVDFQEKLKVANLMKFNLPSSY